MQKWIVTQMVLSAALLSAVFVHGQEPAGAEKEKADALTAKRYELMSKRMGDVKVQSSEEGFPTKLADKPIFRYTDPARSYVAAAVWKIGDEGRPRGLITSELHRQFYGTPRIVFEFLSFTPTKFSARSNDFNWMPEASAVEFKPVPKADAPEATPARRLLQMRAIAKRFTGSELVGKEKVELRLLPQPIDRYTPSKAERSDGSIFLLSFGTNPEAALLIESDGKAWHYAAGRLAGAQTLTLMIDNELAYEAPPVRYGANSPYTASNAPADIPGISSDGKEIAE